MKPLVAILVAALLTPPFAAQAEDIRDCSFYAKQFESHVKGRNLGISLGEALTQLDRDYERNKKGEPQWLRDSLTKDQNIERQIIAAVYTKDIRRADSESMMRGCLNAWK